MTAVPGLLIREVRLAFRSCARHHVATRKTTFSTGRPLLKKFRPSPPPRAGDDPPIQVIHHRQQAQQQGGPTTPGVSEQGPPASTEIVPRGDDGGAVSGHRRVPVPVRVVPKAQVTPQLSLSAKERLQIEILTRKLPPKAEQRIYKKRLRIYHAGRGRIYMMTFVRIGAILALSVVSFIVVPAHWSYGTEWWLVAGIWLAAFVPLVFVNWATRPIVTEVFLHLPQYAQHSAKAAMDYAKSLPHDAKLDVRFMRVSSIADAISLRIADTRPAKSFLKPVTFEWVGRNVAPGSFLRPNPKQFYVRPDSAPGKAARDTVPGIWKSVYARLAGVESEVVARWRR